MNWACKLKTAQVYLSHLAVVDSWIELLNLGFGQEFRKKSLRKLQISVQHEGEIFAEITASANNLLVELFAQFMTLRSLGLSMLQEHSFPLPTLISVKSGDKYDLNISTESRSLNNKCFFPQTFIKVLLLEFVFSTSGGGWNVTYFTSQKIAILIAPISPLD